MARRLLINQASAVHRTTTRGSKSRTLSESISFISRYYNKSSHCFGANTGGSIDCRRSISSSRVVSDVRTFESENPDLVKPEAEKIFFEDFEPGEEIPLVPLPPFDDGSGKIMASPELHDLSDRILKLSFLEIYQLTLLMNEHFDFDDDNLAMGGMDGGGGGSGGEAKEEEVVEEKTAFDLKLTGFDSKSKIKVIKEVRAIAELGLKEAKELVEGAPKVVKKGIKQEDAEKLKEKLESIGATVEIV